MKLIFGLLDRKKIEENQRMTKSTTKGYKMYYGNAMNKNKHGN